MILDVKINARYDVENDILIIDIPHAGKAIGTMPINANALADLDVDGKVTGIEILRYARFKKKKPNDNPGTN